MTYSVAAVKTFTGREGYGYNCNLLRDGKKIASVIEDASGGPIQIHWEDRGTKAEVTHRNYDDTPLTYNGTVEEAAFQAFIMTLPKDDGMFPNDAIYIEELIYKSKAIKKIDADKKKCLTAQVGAKVLTWKLIPGRFPTVESLRAPVLKLHPTAVILNDMPTEQIYDIYKAANLV